MTTHRSLASLGASRWRALAGDDDFYLSPAWLRTVEDDFTTAFVTLERDGADTAGAVACRVPSGALVHHCPPRMLLDSEVWRDLESLLDETERSQARRLRATVAATGVLERPSTVCGIPFAFVSSLCGAAGEAADVLDDGLRATAAEWGTGSTAYLYVTEEQVKAVDAPLTARGYVRSLLMPACSMPVTWRDFDGYLAGLSGKRRRHVRKELAAVGGATTDWLEGDRILPHLDRMAELSAALMRRYGYDATPAAERPVLERLVEGLHDNVRVTLVHMEGRTVAFGLFYLQGETLYASMSGQDYSVPGAHFTAAFYEPVRRVPGMGVTSIHYGPDGYETKVGRGCRLVPSWGYFDFGDAARPHLRALASLHDRARSRQTGRYAARNAGTG
ncbi:GNAT family N-acetyltransferase [Streptomyces longwoodensis]|uniref:GNAT family N-acetyltransferase n=1 Tax=Streptomyces longwoodensis TaxID=68231 RepID=UPI0034019BF3